MRNRHLLWAGFCLLLALIPILNMVGILATTGVDTVSNDYLMFVQQADRFLSGQNEWPAYFHDTLYTGVHSYAFLFPLRLLLLRLSNLSIYAEIYTGILLAIARLGLFYHLLTAFLPESRRPWHRSPYLWLLPALSALVFSTAQISTFSYGETILQLGLTQLLILLGLTLLLHRPTHLLSTWGAVFCGLLASFSGGSGLAAWPLFLLAMVWTNRRGLTRYTAWLLGLALASWPYMAYSAFGSLDNFQRPQFERLLVGLGLPFANNINYGLQSHPQAAITGSLGVLLVLASLALLAWRKPCVFRQQAAPALLLVTWGLLLAVQILLSRLLIAPWYNTSYSLFWIGLLGLLPLLIDRRLLSHIGRLGWRDRLLPTWGLGVLAILLVLYGQSNLTYEDKSFYLPSRSPASAACLRNYQSAPTYCELLVFQRSPGQPASLRQLGQPLARHQLSVFAPDQEWTLQGDYGLGRVQWQPDSQLGRVSWVRGEHEETARWTDYHHLAVLVPPGQSIRWQLDLPGGLKSVHFKSQLTAAASGMCVPGQAAPSFWILLEDQNGERYPLWRFDNVCMLDGGQALDLNLSAYAGQQVTLVLAAGKAGPGAPAARLNYPRLLLQGVPASTSSAAHSLPLNTDLSPDFPTIDENAYRLAVESQSGWQFDHLSQDGPAGRYIKSSTSAATRVTLPTPACLADWSQFYVQASMPNSYRRKLIQVRFTYQSSDAQPGEVVRDLPLLEGEALHTYSINLDLANFPLDACITKVELLLNYNLQPSAAMWVELQEAGFFPRYR